MDKIIIFGATDTGKRIYEDIKDEADVIAFADEDSSRWNTKVSGIPIRNPQEIPDMQFDYIFIGVLTYYEQVLGLLKKLGISADRIVGRYVEIPTYARVECLKNIAALLKEDGIMDGAVAELGVYRGDFAKEINKVFLDRKFYLFDTFGGFDTKDCEIEVERGYAERSRKGYFSNTTEQMVMEKMKHPQMCKICKGIFPKSAGRLEEEFCFVNLDADLYMPTLAGLEYFYPRMVEGG